MTNKTAKILSGICKVLIVSGVIATPILAAYETPKFLKKKTELENSKPEGTKPTVWEYIKVGASSYALPAATGVTTIASVVGDGIINNKIQLSLAGAVVTAEQMYKRYGDAAKKTLGIDGHKKILNEVKNEEAIAIAPKLEEFKEKSIYENKKIYWNNRLGFFMADPLQLRDGLKDFSDNLFKDGYSSLQDLVDYCNIELLNENAKKELKNWGWNYDLIEQDSRNIYDGFPLFRYDIDEDCECKDRKINIASVLYFHIDPIYDFAKWTTNNDDDITINECETAIECYRLAKWQKLANILKYYGCTDEEYNDAVNGKNLERLCEVYDIGSYEYKDKDVPSFVGNIIDGIEDRLQKENEKNV